MRTARIWSISEVAFMAKQFEWRKKLGNVNPQRSVDPADLLRLPVVCEVLAVPCQEDVTFMPGCKRQMQGIASLIARHDQAVNVNPSDFNGLLVQAEQRKRMQ